MPNRIVGKCLLPEILNHSHMTLTELAAKTGISKNQLSKYANNKGSMSLATARIISKAIKTPIDEMYEWKI
jgi:transcriptional regulator with XRE-family HTH domain